MDMNDHNQDSLGFLPIIEKFEDDEHYSELENAFTTVYDIETLLTYFDINPSLRNNGSNCLLQSDHHSLIYNQSQSEKQRISDSIKSFKNIENENLSYTMSIAYISNIDTISMENSEETKDEKNELDKSNDCDFGTKEKHLFFNDEDFISLPPLSPPLSSHLINDEYETDIDIDIDMESTTEEEEEEEQDIVDEEKGINNNNNKKGLYQCQIKECGHHSFNTKKEFDSHNLEYHDVGLEIRFIMFAAEVLREEFPRIGLQCPYINCDEELFFQTIDAVIYHLVNEHNEDLKDLMATEIAKKKNITTMYKAARFCMDHGKIPSVFDDKVIYCCPFTKNKKCTSKCFVENADLLKQHLFNFHCINDKDAQFIINILRFIEIKPIWRAWSDKKKRQRIHQRLNILLKYKGNIRKGFVKQYVNLYTKKYLKTNSKFRLDAHHHFNKKQSFPIINKYNGIIDDKQIKKSIIDNKDLFWGYVNSQNIGVDKEIFEHLINKEIEKRNKKKRKDNPNDSNNQHHSNKKRKL